MTLESSLLRAEVIEERFAVIAVAPDDEEFLARRRIVSPRIIAYPAVADVHTVHDRQTKRPAALDHSPAHAAHIVRMDPSSVNPDPRGLHAGTTVTRGSAADFAERRAGKSSAVNVSRLSSN